MHCRLTSLRWVLLGSGLLLIGCREEPMQQAPTVPLVSAAQTKEISLADHEDLIGRTDAVSKVDIRARVSGYLVKVSFKDGDVVKQGDLLYQIDPRPFQETLDQALGQVERLEADKKLMTIQVGRYTKLVETQAASRQQLDEYLAQQASNIGALKSAEAQVASAKLNLEFTRITAPITGRIGRTLMTEGNLVQTDQTLLTTLVSLDPMYVYFDVEEPTILHIRKMIRDGVIKARNEREVTIRMGLADDVDRIFPMEGRLDFVNNQVDPQTGTLQVRAVFANPYHIPDEPPVLAPGMFVRVRLPLGIPKPMVLVNQRAIATDQGKKYVFVLDDQGKAQRRDVKLGMNYNNLRAVEEGLKKGERVVVSGLQRVRPGMLVKAEMVDMETLVPIESKPASPKATAEAMPAEQAPGTPAKAEQEVPAAGSAATPAKEG